MPVYILGAGDTPMTKIGWAASDVPGRVRELQAGCWETLRVLRVAEGCRATEGWFHRRFAAHRVAREWFKFAPEMLTVVPPIDAPRPRNRAGIVAGILAQFGGARHVRDITGASRNAINLWHDGGIPFRHWPALIRAAEEGDISGVTLDSLASTRSPRFSARAQAA